ncbi:ATP-dependent RNA helicase rhlE [mine drainage metagenome]|uniref:ATP-dependent RNA helicase rhlE n=1 Tax=mine drainage metagenome TaxID=410659 RepID=T1C195_9ZZZZ
MLDEADRMLDMGFIHDMKKIFAVLPKARQTLLFSATFSDAIRALTEKLLKNPQRIDVAPRNATAATVSHTMHPVPQSRKRDLLVQLINDERWMQALVFTRTKHGANRLVTQLEASGIQTLAIHGNKSQNARTKALGDFKTGKLQVLVATDIAARGIDISELPVVVNYELPNVPEDYVHRIGRTGRAGSTGRAVSLVCSEEMGYLRDIERLIGRGIERVLIPGFETPARAEATAPAPTRRHAQPGRARGNQANHASHGMHASHLAAPAAAAPHRRKRGGRGGNGGGGAGRAMR